MLEGSFADGPTEVFIFEVDKSGRKRIILWDATANSVKAEINMSLLRTSVTTSSEPRPPYHDTTYAFFLGFVPILIRSLLQDLCLKRRQMDWLFIQGQQDMRPGVLRFKHDSMDVRLLRKRDDCRTSAFWTSHVFAIAEALSAVRRRLYHCVRPSSPQPRRPKQSADDSFQETLERSHTGHRCKHTAGSSFWSHTGSQKTFAGWDEPSAAKSTKRRSGTPTRCCC